MRQIARRRISSQIGWLTQNSEPSSQPADPRDGARDGLDAPAHRSALGLSSHTRSGQRQVDISRQLLSHRRLQAGNYKDRDGASESRGPCSWLPAACGGAKVAY